MEKRLCHGLASTTPPPLPPVAKRAAHHSLRPWGGTAVAIPLEQVVEATVAVAAAAVRPSLENRKSGVVSNNRPRAGWRHTSQSAEAAVTHSMWQPTEGGPAQSPNNVGSGCTSRLYPSMAS